jgi:transcriptional regulator with XRE-family HTH domain
MDIIEETAIGLRIRMLRKRNGLTMVELASSSGLSINTISKIERGETSPTVASLRKISTALAVPMLALFKEENEETVIFTKCDERPSTHVTGAIFQSLGAGLADQSLVPMIIVLDPKAGSNEDTYSHSGEEFVFCLEGKVEYRVGNTIHQMDIGDSILFDPTQSHSFSNPKDEPAKILLIIHEQDIENRRIAHEVHKNGM